MSGKLQGLCFHCGVERPLYWAVHDVDICRDGEKPIKGKAKILRCEVCNSPNCVEVVDDAGAVVYQSDGQM